MEKSESSQNKLKWQPDIKGLLTPKNPFLCYCQMLPGKLSALQLANFWSLLSLDMNLSDSGSVKACAERLKDAEALKADVHIAWSNVSAGTWKVHAHPQIGGDGGHGVLNVLDESRLVFATQWRPWHENPGVGQGQHNLANAHKKWKSYMSALPVRNILTANNQAQILPSLIQHFVYPTLMKSRKKFTYFFPPKEPFLSEKWPVYRSFHTKNSVSFNPGCWLHKISVGWR